MNLPIAQSTIQISTIIIAVLSSSLLTACFTKAVEFYFNKLNYKRDYLKIILERRLNASETLLNLLFESGNQIQDFDGKIYSPAFDNSDKIIKYFDRLLNIQNYRMWLGTTVDTHYRNFLVYLNDSKFKFEIDINSSDSDCINFSKDINIEQIKLGRRLHLAIMKDLKHLYKVDDFFDEEIEKAVP